MLLPWERSVVKAELEPWFFGSCQSHSRRRTRLLLAALLCWKWCSVFELLQPFSCVSEESFQLHEFDVLPIQRDRDPMRGVMSENLAQDFVLVINQLNAETVSYYVRSDLKAKRHGER